jgi:hypothetical protein
MRKGKHRRHREARAMKHQTLPMSALAIDADDTTHTAMVDDDDVDTMCDECQRSPHATWCMAETAI